MFVILKQIQYRFAVTFGTLSITQTHTHNYISQSHTFAPITAYQTDKGEVLNGTMGAVNLSIRSNIPLGLVP